MAVRVRTRAVLAALAACAVLGSSGCVSLADTPSVEPVSTSRPMPSSTRIPQIPAVIVLDADGLSVRTEAGAEIFFLPYDRDPADAIAALTRMFDAPPETTYSPGDEVCDPPTTFYKWDGLYLFVYGDPARPSEFSAGAQYPAEHTTMIVETLHGGRIGGSFAALLSTNPETPNDSFEYQGEQWETLMDGISDPELASTPDEERPGVRVMAIDDSIISIFAPVAFLASC